MQGKYAANHAKNASNKALHTCQIRFRLEVKLSGSGQVWNMYLFPSDFRLRSGYLKRKSEGQILSLKTAKYADFRLG